MTDTLEITRHVANEAPAQRAVRMRPSTTQRGHLTHIGAGACSASELPFDFTGHRTLDTEPATAWLHHVHDSRLGMREAPHRLAGRARKPHQRATGRVNGRVCCVEKCRTAACVMLPEKSGRDSPLDELIDERAAKERRKSGASPKTSAPKR